jgi:hypothetical protein
MWACVVCVTLQAWRNPDDFVCYNPDFAWFMCEFDKECYEAEELARFSASQAADLEDGVAGEHVASESP